MYYIFIEDGKINGCGQCRCMDDSIINLDVEESAFNDYRQNPSKYIYSDGKIIENPEYDLIKQRELAEDKINDIKQELGELDSKRVRAVCENEIKDSATGETWLEYYNARVLELRSELNVLQKQLLSL